MWIESVAVESFRNFDRLHVGFGTQSHFIRGGNGQGKTNLLEALGLITSLRSFRIAEQANFLRWESPDLDARLLFTIRHEERGECELEIALGRRSKRILLDGNPVKRMGDFIGTFPTVAFSSQDIQILRGSPGMRRRWMDMLLVDLHRPYYGLLLRYHQALKSRNALLKQRSAHSALQPFEQLLVASGWQLQALRQRLLSEFEPYFEKAYAAISRVAEKPQLRYQPNLQAQSEQEYAAVFAIRSQRDAELRTTSHGPHRDDVGIFLQDHPAREYASEGQQRGLVLALRMGHVDWLCANSGVRPVVLADDIVGELDADRRAGFWKMVDDRIQVFATGTALPALQLEGWGRWDMLAGVALPMAGEAAQ